MPGAIPNLENGIKADPDRMDLRMWTHTLVSSIAVQPNGIPKSQASKKRMKLGLNRAAITIPPIRGSRLLFLLEEKQDIRR